MPNQELLQRFRARIANQKAKEDAPETEEQREKTKMQQFVQRTAVVKVCEGRREIQHIGSRNDLIAKLNKDAEEQRVRKHANKNLKNSSASKSIRTMTKSEHQGVRIDSRTEGVIATKMIRGGREVHAAVSRLLNCQRKPPVLDSLSEPPERHIGVLLGSSGAC